MWWGARAPLRRHTLPYVPRGFADTYFSDGLYRSVGCVAQRRTRFCCLGKVCFAATQRTRAPLGGTSYLLRAGRMFRYLYGGRLKTELLGFQTAFCCRGRVRRLGDTPYLASCAGCADSPIHTFQTACAVSAYCAWAADSSGIWKIWRR
ncbi:hypothetical protein [Kingella potus]|uniref:hypothetical protein n=1 Tax=Kingella potus TaxID=265175 RepID=UPI001FD42F57|nr:hypothetical protein [Kingella potus]UOP01145.1 hypothetical protein LVJ84_02145 [Kingella potus]